MKYILLILLLTSCHKVWKPRQHEVYTISKGQHECNERSLAYLNSPFLTLQFTPDESWYYEPQYDKHWNKLGGISSNQIHQNSIRIAWRCTLEEIKLAIYEYRDGERVITELGSIDDGWWSIIIEMDKNRVVFREKYFETGTHEEKGWLCYPYFGGKEPAPHDMIFKINFHHR